MLNRLSRFRRNLPSFPVIEGLHPTHGASWFVAQVPKGGSVRMRSQNPLERVLVLMFALCTESVLQRLATQTYFTYACESVRQALTNFASGPFLTITMAEL